MEDRINQARAYLTKCRPAISGQAGHNTAYALSCWIVHGFDLNESQAYEALQDWNQTCDPPWSENDLRHKIRDALKAQPRKAKGHLLRFGGDRRKQPTFRLNVAGDGPDYDYDDALHELPEAIEDGTRSYLRAMFRPGESVRLVMAKLNDKGKEIPADGGITMPLEQWLKKLDYHDGNPNGFFSSSDGTGIYVGINPYKEGATKDEDVTDMRHALVEFDDGLTPAEQFKLYTDSNLPCAAITYSGGRSVHALVLVEAKDRKEYDERVKDLYAYFAERGFKIDAKNKNPGRLSRLPGCRRFDKRQELLAVRCGAKNFGAWLAARAMESAGREDLPQDLLKFDFRNDPDRLLGQRYLCRGGSLLVVGPSGIGKSSLLMQLCVSLAIGQPFFGIKNSPGKVLMIQAENDKGDMAEMFQGTLAGMGINEFESEDKLSLVLDNIRFRHLNTQTGIGFVDAVQSLIEHYKAQYVAIDPLLSFVGADISKQEVCSQFLRSWLNPISDTTGVIWLIAHHTGKPNAKAREGWGQYDHAYAGMGSSELVNWARAIMVLESVGDGVFRLRLSKRGNRAGAKHPDGNPTVDVYLKHAEHGIHWDQVLPPVAVEEKKSSRQKGGRHQEYDITRDNVAEIIGKGCNKKDALKLIAQWVIKQHDQVLADRTARDYLKRWVLKNWITEEKGIYHVAG